METENVAVAIVEGLVHTIFVSRNDKIYIQNSILKQIHYTESSEICPARSEATAK